MNTQEESDYADKVKAARAMLAALIELRSNAAKYSRMQIWDVTQNAIAQAESAGIVAED